MTIVTSSTPVTLVGPAEFAPKDLEAALIYAPTLVAADGGAGRALALGKDPTAVIGDMDSIPDDAKSRLADRLHEIEEQDTTDFDKALRSIAAPLTIAVGFAGGRQDHDLAVLSTLCGRPDRPCIVLGPETLTLHCPPRLELDLAAGALVSLFPLRPVTITTAGLVWSVTALDLEPGGRLGTSNAAAGGRVTVSASGTGLLVILRREDLDQAVAALSGG